MLTESQLVVILSVFIKELLQTDDSDPALLQIIVAVEGYIGDEIARGQSIRNIFMTGTEEIVFLFKKSKNAHVITKSAVKHFAPLFE